MRLRILMKYKWIAGASLCLVAALAITARLLWPTPHAAKTYPPARTRTTIDVTVCLLTGPNGVSASSDAASDDAAWKGILAAQESTNIRAQNFPVSSPENAQNAQIAVNTLALRGCALIITTGKTENAAAASQAHLFPHTEFAPQTAANTTSITASVKARTLNLIKNQ